MAKYVLGESAARKVKALLNGPMTVGRVPSAGAGVVDERDFPLIFTVQWAESADYGSGGWIIWLPGEAHVVFASSAVNLAEDLSEAGDPYPEGWYLLGDLLEPEEDGELWLHVNPSSSTAEIVSEEPDDGLTKIKICDVTFDSDTHARSVKGYLFSTVTIGAGTGDLGCFRLTTAVNDNDESYLTLANPIYGVGGVIKKVPTANIPSIRPGFLVEDDPPEGYNYHYDDRPYVFLQVVVQPFTASNGAGALGYATVDALKAFDTDSLQEVPYREGEVETRETVMDRSAVEDGRRYYVRPLYKLAHDGSIVIDYRNMPELSPMEF